MNKIQRKSADTKLINEVRYKILLIAKEFNLDSIHIYRSQNLECTRIRHCITYILTDILKISYWSTALITYKKSHQTIISASTKFCHDLEINKLYKSVFNKCIKYFGDING